MAGAHFFCVAPIATRHADISTVGSGIAIRVGQTESGASVGDAVLVPDYAIRQKGDT
jgi:hypothetical protein